MPRASVDSQMGPRRASVRGQAARRPRDRPAIAGEGDDRVPGAVQRGPDELGHPGIDDDLAPAAIADVEDTRDQPAGPRDERASWLDREAARPAVLGDRLEQSGELAGEALGLGPGSSSGRPGSRHRRRACRSPLARHREARRPPSPRRTASRQASTARTATRHAGGAAWADRPVRSDVTPRRPRRLGLGHPELRRAVADGEAGDASRASTSGLSRTRTSSAGRRRAEPARRARRVTTSASSAEFEGDPAERRRRSPRHGRRPAGPRRSCRRPRA